LNLNADAGEPVWVPNRGKWPGTYYRLAADSQAKFGHKPMINNGSWRQTNASRYIRKFQSRRSLLVWKIYGRRLDGWDNNDFPTEKVPGDANTLQHNGQSIEGTRTNRNRADLDFVGSAMPPASAVKSGKVQALSDDDRKTIVRWIDLGCPIDLDFDPTNPARRGFGWMCDDKRPTLTLNKPARGVNPKLNRIVVGMDDYYSGLHYESMIVTADFAINGISAGTNLANQFQEIKHGIFELKLNESIQRLKKSTMVVSVKDRQGNITTIRRTFSVR
jgi:hypothetical protein